MFLDDIVNPLNELSKDQLKKYIKANAADAVQRTSSDSFKSGAAGDKYNKSEFDTPVDRKRERGMDRALNKLAREDSNDFSAVDSTSPIHGGLEEDGPMAVPALGAVGARAQKDLFATPQQFIAQQTNLKAGGNAPVQWKKLTPTTAQDLGVRVDAQYVAAPNGGITIKGLATSYENKTQFPFAMTIDADHQIRYKNVEKLNDDELDAVFQNLASNGLLDRQYINPLKAQLAEDKKSEVEKHAKDQEYVRNDPILHYGGNIAGVKSAVRQAKKKHPTAKNDVEAMFAQIGDEGDINQSQEQLLQKHKRVINQLTQQVTQLGAENQEQTDMIAKLSNMLRQTPAAPSQQVAQKQQGLGEESKPRLTRIHYFNVDQPTIAQEIGLKQDRGGNWCLYQFDTSGAGFDRKFTQASRVFGRPTHSQAVAEDAFHSDEVGNSWSDGQGQWSSGNNQISSGNNPQGFSEGFQDFNKVEPYAVCLAGKPVKTFDYYEDARRFHDNWKKKLYNQGDKVKADKITLMPVTDEAANPAQQAAIAIAMKKAHKKPKQVDELDVNTLKSYADKRGAQVAAMKADNPNPVAGSPEWVQQAVPAQQVNLAKRKIARKERQPIVAEDADQVKKVFKDKSGKPVGEIGIDPESSPGNGEWYVHHYATGYSVVGFDSAAEAKRELMYVHKHPDAVEGHPSTKEQGVAEGEGVVDPKIQFLQPTIQFAEKHGYKVTINPNPNGKLFAKLVNKQIEHTVRIGFSRGRDPGTKLEAEMTDDWDRQTWAWSARELAQDFKEFYRDALRDSPVQGQQGVAEEASSDVIARVEQIASKK